MTEPATGQIIAGKYRIESLIGHGGMGSVWRARHASLDMPVAIKFMGAHADADLESRQRFDREARALASLRSQHIVQVLDHGVDGDTPYIVMELLEGEDLSTRMARQKRLALDETSRILSQTARGLRRAHEAGVTHRDLKPSNIFLARIDDDEVVKVLDFGVAKLAATGALGDQLTRTGTLLGSPGYMSPEQARGKEVDFRSDLWALAVIVFRAVTGVKPFSGDSIAELVIKLCIDPRPVASRFAPDLPPAVDRFFEKAFAPTPEDRFASAVEMAAAFAAWVGQPAVEMSRSGPSPFAGVSAAALDAPPAAAGPSLPVAPPATFPLPVAPPATPLAVAALSREPTPTPGSFAGFAPSVAETASAPPAAGSVPPLPDLATPTGMRLHPPGPPVAPPSPPPASAPRALDLKTLLFAAAGAAVLAVFFAMAIAGLKRRHANALRPDERDVSELRPGPASPEDDPATTSASAALSAAPTADPAPTVDPSAAPTPEPSATAAPSSDPASPDPSAAPVTGSGGVEGPVDPAVSPTSTSAAAPATTPLRPTGSSAPTTKSSGKTAPTGSSSAKKKNQKPNFGY